MANNIKGITVEIGGNTAPLDKALKDVNKTSRDLQSELREVNRQLKLDPTNTILLEQKQKLLAESVANTKGKLDTLKQAEQQAQEQFKQGKISEEQYRALQREVIKTTEQIKNLEKQAQNSNVTLSKVSTTAGKIGDGAGNVAGKMAPATLAIVGLGTAAVTTGMNFEAQMSRVQAISGSTKDELQLLNNQAIQLGADTSFSATEAAQGMENLASAGFSTTEIMAAMPGMLDLAASGGVEIADASDIAASALRGFGLEANQSGHVADVLAKAAADTNAEVTDMGAALKYAAPPAHALGLSIEEVSASIGIMANAGIKGDMAGTTLRGALTKLSSPSKEAAATMKELGINAFDSQGKMLPLSQVIANLQNGMSGLTDEQKQNAVTTIFGQESMSGMLTLIQAGPKQLDDLTNSFKRSDGAAKEMANTMLDNGKGSIEEMKGSIETAAITISDVLAPIITQAAQYVTSLANNFARLDEGSKKVILVILGLIAAIAPVAGLISGIATIVGATTTVITTVSGAIAIYTGTATTASLASKNLAAAMKFITGPVGITITIIAALAAAFIYFWNTSEAFRDFWINLWNTVKSVASNAVNTIVTFFTTTIPGAWNSVINFFQGIPTWFNNLWISTKTITINIWNQIKDFFSTVWTNIKNSVTNIVNNLINWINNKFGTEIFLIQVILDHLKNIFTQYWTIIKNVVLGLILIIIDLVTGNFNKLSIDISHINQNIRNALISIWNDIKQVFISTWLIIQLEAQSIWNSIVNVANDLWNGLASFFVSLWAGIVTNAENAWIGFKNTIISIISGIVSEAINIFNNIINFFTGLPGTLSNLGATAFNALKSGISSAINGIGSIVINGFNSAINFLTSLPSKALEWGKDFIQELINGITSMIGKVTDAVNGVANKIRSILHFSVPDEGPLSDADTYGADFMQLIADTIEQSSDKPAEAAQKVADLVSQRIQSIKSNTANAVTSLYDDLAKLGQQEQSALSGVTGSERYSILEEYNDKRNIINQEIVLRKQQADKEIAEIQRIGKLSKDELKSELQSRKDFANSVNNLNSQIVDALKEKYSEEEKAQEDSLNNQLDALDKWKDASEKAIDDVANAKIAALQAESDAVDEQQKMQDRTESNQNDLNNINKLKSSLQYEHNDYNKAELQKQIDQATTDYNKKLQQQAIEDKKDSLKKQMDTIKADADKQKQDIENIYNTQKTYLQKGLSDLKAFYDKKLSDANLNAEAERMIMQNNQESIVTLLNSYGDQYKQAGQTLGDRLAEGFQPAIDNIKGMIASITAQISEARDNALSAMATANAASNAITASIPTIQNSSGSGSTSTSSKSTVMNNEINITSPVAQTPSQQRTALETTLQKLAYQMA